MEIWWDRSVEITQDGTFGNHPGVIVVDGAAQEWMLADFSLPWDRNVVTKEDEKVTKYTPMAKEIRKRHSVSTKTVRLVIGCFGVVSG